MARGRIITPEFWTDGNMIGLSFAARLFYIGMWNFALCDKGHLADDAMGLKLKVLPADPVDPEALVSELEGCGRVVRVLLADGRKFLHIPTFEQHQKSDSRWKSRCPVCTLQDSPKLTETHLSLVEHAETLPNSAKRGEERNGEEKKGSATKRGTRIPSDFSITAEMRAWAQENTPNVDPDKRLPEFIDYWAGVAGQKGVKLDWLGTWRNDMRRKQEFAARDSGAPSKPKKRFVAYAD